jgi:hypothetical protein
MAAAAVMTAAFTTEVDVDVLVGIDIVLVKERCLCPSVSVDLNDLNSLGIVDRVVMNVEPRVAVVAGV